ncbi:MAG: lysophospholipid acyltransferase family protein [Permianibacter sp.]
MASTAISRRWLVSSRRRLRQGACAVAVLIWLGLAALLCLLLQWRIWRRPGVAVLQPFMQPWFQVVVHLLGVRQSCAGRRPAAGTLLLCNHISWLDIVVIGAQLPVRFVAKAEVRRWPLLGTLAAAAGTVFLQRGRRSGPDSSAEVKQLIGRALAAGELVLLFPEGTTSDGRRVRRFHARLIPAGYPVAPLALAYRGDGAAAVPFLGADSLAASLWRLLAERDVHAHLQLLRPVDDSDASQPAHAAQQAVARALAVPTAATPVTPTVACGENRSLSEDAISDPAMTGSKMNKGPL